MKKKIFDFLKRHEGETFTVHEIAQRLNTYVTLDLSTTLYLMYNEGKINAKWKKGDLHYYYKEHRKINFKKGIVNCLIITTLIYLISCYGEIAVKNIDKDPHYCKANVLVYVINQMAEKGGINND